MTATADPAPPPLSDGLTNISLYTMLTDLLAMSPLPPLLVAATIGCGIVSGFIKGEQSERFTSRAALGSSLISLLLIGAASYSRYSGSLESDIILGTWLSSGDFRIDMGFTLDGLSLTLAVLSALFAVMVIRFSINYMHRETGFHRFFLVLSLFAGSMLLLTTAGNLALCFIGWELAGVSSYLLIAYNYDRPTAADNATRAIVTNRLGDAGFILGIVLAFLWTGGISWSNLTEQATLLEGWQAGILACSFLLAAMAKSALVPLSPWLARAMEGPTPSSAIFYGAVMVHAGVYLVLRLQPLFVQAPLIMDLMALLGLLTALYGFFCGLAQTDVKSALIFSTSGQIGLMFFAAGLGFWRLALYQLCAHALFRGYQFLTAPSLMHGIIGIPQRPVTPSLGRSRRLYMAALQRLWLESLGERVVVKPVQSLASDLNSFDRQVVEPIFGLPAPMASVASSLTQAEYRRSRGKAAVNPEILRVSGLPGWLVRTCADALHWFEEKLVLQSVGQNMINQGRRLGVRLNHIEDLLNQPRYLIGFVLVTLLALL